MLGQFGEPLQEGLTALQIGIIVGWIWTLVASGAMTAWLAYQRERDPAAWFFVGLVAPLFAQLAVGLAPPGESVLGKSGRAFDEPTE